MTTQATSPTVHPAQLTLLRLLEDGVGEEIRGLTFGAVQQADVNFSVVERYQLKAATTPATITGKVRPGTGTRFVSPSQYSQAATELLQEEAASKAVRDFCVGKIGAFKYCECTGGGELALHVNDSDVMAHRECVPCGATGSTDCPTCSGRGKVTCHRCQGRRSTQCYSCGGAGSVTKHRDVFSGGKFSHQEMVRVSCNCQGGRIACHTCDVFGQVRCSQCNNGKVTCRPCAGTGWFTDRTGVRTLASYSRDVEFGSNVSQAAMGSVDTFLRKTDWMGPLTGHTNVGSRSISESVDSVAVRYPFAAPEVSYQVKIGSHDTVARHFGLKNFPVDGGGLATELVSDHIAALDESNLRGFNILAPSFGRRAALALTSALKAPLHVKVVEGFARSKNFNNSLRAGLDAVHDMLTQPHATGLFVGVKGILTRAHWKRFGVGLLASMVCGGGVAWAFQRFSGAPDLTSVELSGSIVGLLVGAAVAIWHAWASHSLISRAGAAPSSALKAFARVHTPKFGAKHVTAYLVVAAVCGFSQAANWRSIGDNWLHFLLPPRPPVASTTQLASTPANKKLHHPTSAQARVENWPQYDDRQLRRHQELLDRAPSESDLNAVPPDFREASLPLAALYTLFPKGHEKPFPFVVDTMRSKGLIHVAQPMVRGNIARVLRDIGLPCKQIEPVQAEAVGNALDIGKAVFVFEGTDLIRITGVQRNAQGQVTDFLIYDPAGRRTSPATAASLAPLFATEGMVESNQKAAY